MHPPTPEEVEAFVADTSPGAFAKVVDRLLSSPRYGERWGRYWLDLARYADGTDYVGGSPEPFANAYRYRDWVIDSFNQDLPYDLFVKAQVAGDLLPEKHQAQIAGLGFQALGRGADDQLDTTTRTFLGLTVACAQCHDHKYDPIPARDYYSLLGIFRSSEKHQYPLAPEKEVAAYQEHNQRISALKESIDEFVNKQSLLLSEVLAAKTAKYLTAAWRVLSPGSQPKLSAKAVSEEEKLDQPTLERLVEYLRDPEKPEKSHPYLKGWYELIARHATPEEIVKFSAEFQSLLLAVIAEKKEVDDRNYVALGGAKGVKDEDKRTHTKLEFLAVDKSYLWRDFCSESFAKDRQGVYYYGEKAISRFLHPESKDYLETKQAELTALKKSLPPHYPFLHTIRDAKPVNLRVAIRGEANNLGEEAPRRFLSILCEGEPVPFTKGSGRLELAEAIASPNNPLTARVMVNRIWHFHFGQGLARTLGNFGQLGDRPSHPELLDYLAARFIETGWSVKALNREIMLSAAYQMSAQHSAENFKQDPEDRLLWRFNLSPRLDIEALRDAVLAVSGHLDLTVGGPATPFDEKNRRRTVYGTVTRGKVEPLLALFDFPDPSVTSEQRTATDGPLQRLFFLNSDFIIRQSKSLAERLNRDSRLNDAAKIEQAYRLLFARPPNQAEVELGLDFLRNNPWWRYAQALLNLSEFATCQ